VSQSVSEDSTPEGDPIDNQGTGNIGDDINYVRHFQGIIDDINIYDYARMPAQILEDYRGQASAVDSPVLSLDFNEGYGSTAHDESEFDNHGTLYPGTSGDNTATSAMWTLDGKVGKALDFDGVDDRIAIANFQFPMTNQFSISHWINW
jgi:hypothetical protein